MYSQQGQVSQVSQKPFTDKWGKNITLHSFQLEGDTRWYRTGTRPPSIGQGDTISFVFEMKGNNCNVDANSIQGGTGGAAQAPAPAPAPQAAPQQAPQQQAAPAPAPSGGGGTRDSYWKDKEVYDKKVTQPRIAYAAAQKSAVSIVSAALAHDVLGFGNAKKADKLQLLLSYVDEVTLQLALKLDSAHLILEEAKAVGISTPQQEGDVDEDSMYGIG